MPALVRGRGYPMTPCSSLRLLCTRVEAYLPCPGVKPLTIGQRLHHQLNALVQFINRFVALFTVTDVQSEHALLSSNTTPKTAIP